MKLEEDNEPARLDEGEPSELGRLVRAARSRGPSAPASARMAERLAPARAAAALASSSRVGLFGRLGGPMFGALALGALALVALGGAFVASSMGRPEHAATPGEAVTATAISAPTEAPLPVTTADLPTMPVEALPSSSATPARVGAGRPAPSSSSERPRREDEFELIQRAQDKLASEPARALATLQEHARLFPAGELTQERETMAVEALVRVHRKPEAKTRANALLARFPRTPYVARLESALGEPLSLEPSVNTPR